MKMSISEKVHWGQDMYKICKRLFCGAGSTLVLHDIYMTSEPGQKKENRMIYI